MTLTEQLIAIVAGSGGGMILIRSIGAVAPKVASAYQARAEAEKQREQNCEKMIKTLEDTVKANRETAEARHQELATEHQRCRDDCQDLRTLNGVQTEHIHDLYETLIQAGITPKKSLIPPEKT